MPTAPSDPKRFSLTKYTGFVKKREEFAATRGDLRRIAA
jgi:hypothetical protein